MQVLLVIAMAMTVAVNCAEPEPLEKVVLFLTDFEDGKGVYSPETDQYTKLGGGRFESNQKESRLEVVAPLGAGNESKFALSCHGAKAISYVDCAAPCFTIGQVEPEGWDGGISFTIRNQGF